MNLELLFWAARESGDSTFYKIAVTHADTTMKKHFRPDYSSFSWSWITTPCPGRCWAADDQGYADHRPWARGQAWGLYGYTVCYRETKDPKYLAQAENIAGLIFSNKNMPEDLIPYWDYDAPGIPDEPRDVSAAHGCRLGALRALDFFRRQREIPRMGRPDHRHPVSELSRTARYHARLFAPVEHRTQTGGTEIDVPIVYADYYFLEALLRKQRLERGKPVNG